MRAAPNFSRSAWSPLEPSVSALRRAGAPQPGIRSRSLPGGAGSWADPLQVDHWRRGPSVDGSAPPTRCVCDAWGDAFPDAPPGKRLDTGAISSSSQKRTPRPRPPPVWNLATLGTSSVHARPVEALTCRFDSRGCPVHRHPRPRAEEAGRTSSTRLLQLAGVERLPRAMNEIWYQGSETPRSGRRVTRVVGQAARGALEHASARPLSSTLCALRAQAIDAAQGQPGREGRRWHPLCQLEEELG